MNEQLNLFETVNEANSPACFLGAVMPSAFGYRFSVTSKQNNKIIGTGFFKSSREMTAYEQISFLHQYTNGIYAKKESFVNIDVFEAEA
jgi:hypothetical protein